MWRGPAPEGAEVSTVKTTCPRDCYDACGISVTLRDGAVASVRGDADHHVSRGKLCGKCSIAYNGVFLDSDQRLTTPLRRSGAKGVGAFSPVTWEQALGDIADRLRETLATRDSRTIVHTHYTGTLAQSSA